MKQSLGPSMGRATTSGQGLERLEPLCPWAARCQDPSSWVGPLSLDQQQGSIGPGQGGDRGEFQVAVVPGHPQGRVTGQPVAVWFWVQEGHPGLLACPSPAEMQT